MSDQAGSAAARVSFTRYLGKGPEPKSEGPRQVSVHVDEDPSGYIAGPGLRNAVNVALALDQPLLISGDPGTGKTRLAASVAHELGLGAPLVFNAKTTSTARDLFYQYEALRHFHARTVAAAAGHGNSSSGGAADSGAAAVTAKDLEPYINYNALGIAILRALDAGRSGDPPADYQDFAANPRRSVVLIDEIDKAPRDFPNDLLNEIEGMEFDVPETRQRYRARENFRPVLILTSNSEKNLPAPFLRRCVFYNIPLPSDDDLQRIVRARLPHYSDYLNANLPGALALFRRVRSLELQKQPSTAEFLRWVELLKRLELSVPAANELGDPTPAMQDLLTLTHSVLVKSKDDYITLCRSLGISNYEEAADLAASRADVGARIALDR